MPNFLFIGRLEKPIHFFPRHEHPNWEIVLYTEGTGTVTLGEQPVPFQPGAIVCMPPNVPQTEESASGSRNIYIHCRSLPNLGAAIPVFQDEASQPFRQLALMLYREFHLQRPNWMAIAQKLFDCLVLHLCRWSRQQPVHSAAERLEHLLLDGFRNPDFRLQEALKAVPLSPAHLRRLFRQATGKAPVQYLNDLRVSEAQNLLRTGGFQVKEVARLAGFTDQYYFSRVFRKQTGLSPREYARRHTS